MGLILILIAMLAVHIGVNTPAFWVAFALVSIILLANSIAKAAKKGASHD